MAGELRKLLSQAMLLLGQNCATNSIEKHISLSLSPVVNRVPYLHLDETMKACLSAAAIILACDVFK